MPICVTKLFSYYYSCWWVLRGETGCTWSDLFFITLSYYMSYLMLWIRLTFPCKSLNTYILLLTYNLSYCMKQLASGLSFFIFRINFLSSDLLSRVRLLKSSLMWTLLPFRRFPFLKTSSLSLKVSNETKTGLAPDISGPEIKVN